VRRAAAIRQHDEHDRDLILAWQIERIAILALKRSGERRLPSLKQLLERKAKGQTPAEQRAVVEALSGRLGVPLQRLVKGLDGRYHAVSQ